MAQKNSWDANVQAVNGGCARVAVSDNGRLLIITVESPDARPSIVELTSESAVAFAISVRQSADIANLFAQNHTETLALPVEPEPPTEAGA